MTIERNACSNNENKDYPEFMRGLREMIKLRDRNGIYYFNMYDADDHPKSVE